MMARHWQRLSDITGHSFDVDSASFSLRDIMEAPLLKYKEDIEVIFGLGFYCNLYDYEIKRDATNQTVCISASLKPAV